MTPDWIAVDWGTTNLRLWLMDAAGAVLAEHTSDRGMARLQPGDYEGVLLDLLGGGMPAGTMPVLCCGMAGARQGWHEAPYRPVPAPPVEAQAAIRVPTRDPRLQVRLLPGLRQDDPPDVMRGEETQIAGLLALEPGFEGLICLPGTHCKWAEIAGGRVLGFQSFMTGELFSLLAAQSVLRHSLAAEGEDAAAFADGLARACRAPERLTAELFPLRAEALLAGLAPVAARARLSGLLIGAELAAMGARLDRGEVAIIGAPGVGALYHAALKALGRPARRLDAAAMTLAGLSAARAELKDRE